MRLDRWLSLLAALLFVVAVVFRLRGDDDTFHWFFYPSMALVLVAGVVRWRRTSEAPRWW